MAIRARRRARFRRATSGTQNLTLLIYNILKEQQAAQKSAILAAFEANMDSASYDATYGDQAVDRAAVEAWYAAAMAAYPEGTTERDRLRAELIQFRANAIATEMNVYQKAYENGTYAFGQKIGLEEYLGFLREAKALSPDNATRMKYTVEEFITKFNDRHDDLKAEDASAGTLLRFYRRQLAVAEEMGITKDSGHYRTIQKYIVSAQKAAAAEAKRSMLDKAQKVLVRRAGKLSAAIEDSVNAAVREGRLGAQDAAKLLNGDALNTVAAFSGLDLALQNTILTAGARAGVTIGDSAISGRAWYTFITDTSDELKALISDPTLSIGIRSSLKSMLDNWNDSVERNAGLIDDVGDAYNSGYDMIGDNLAGYGSPIVNVEGYQRHAAKIAESGARDVSGDAILSIMNGFVPDPNEFGGKTELWQLTAEEQRILTERYTGETFLGMNPVDAINSIVNDYKVKNQVESGQSYLAITVAENGDPVVDVVPTRIANGVPFFYTSKMSDGRTVSSIVQQQKVPVLSKDGATLGNIVFDVGDGGVMSQKFITLDNVSLDLDDMENYMASKGYVIAGSMTDGFQVTMMDDTNAVVNSAPLMASSIATDTSWGSIVPKTNNGDLITWDGTTGNVGKAEAIKERANLIANSMSLLNGATNVVDMDQATGELIIKDEKALIELTGGMDAYSFKAMMNQGVGNQIKEIIASNLFRRMQGAEGRAQMGQITEEDLARYRMQGAQARVDYETKRRDTAQNSALAPFKVAANILPGGAGLLQLGQAAYNFLNPGPEVTAAKNELTRVRTPESAISKMSPAFAGTSVSPQSDYFFRYAGGIDNAPSPLSKAPTFDNGSLGKPPAARTTTFEPKFTAQEIEQSLIDFRAGERNI
jgi:hypothetical protein